MDDSAFMVFQDEFYDLLERNGVSEISCGSANFNPVCKIRNKVAEFIEEQLFIQSISPIGEGAVGDE